MSPPLPFQPLNLLSLLDQRFSSTMYLLQLYFGRLSCFAEEAKGVLLATLVYLLVPVRSMYNSCKYSCTLIPLYGSVLFH